MKVRRAVPAALLILAMAAALPAVAQEEQPELISTGGLALTTSYTAIAVEPSESATFQLTVGGVPGEQVQMSVTDVPTGWTARFRGGTFVVSRVTLEPDCPDDAVPCAIGTSPNLRLEVEVPPEAAEGSYRVSIAADGESGSAALDLDLLVSLAVSGGVSLTTEFPALRGPSDVTFSYTLDLANDTSEEVTFGLSTLGPPGWQIEARPAGQSRASTVTLEAGDSSRITVDVDPSDLTPAGVYSVIVQASGSGESTETELLTEITGNFDVELTTTDQRLNMTAVAGEVSQLPLIVVNPGTAALIDVNMLSTPPRGWDVTFEPETLPRIEPGAFAEVIAVVTPAEDAVAGDYRISFTASVPEARDSVEVRATVETSLFWGLVGVGIIVLALLGLVYVFRRYGRR